MSNRELKGAIHLHTDLSHDGELSFEQLTSFLERQGYDFMAITEHSYDVNQEQMDNLAEMAKARTTDDFLVIPGIEFRCHSGVDILGLGVYQTTPETDLSRVIDHIHAHGGIAIFAHPGQRPGYEIAQDWICQLDGAEIYNLKEGKLMPNFKTMAICRQLKQWHPELKITFGLDLHTTDGFLFLSNTVSAEKNETETILNAFRNGSFRNESALFNLGSDGRMNVLYRSYVYAVRTALNLVRWLRDLLHI